MQINEIISKVSENLKPTTEYDEIISKTLLEIKHSASKLGFDVEVFIGGSYAKNTHIGNSFDCDVFVRFKDGNEFSENLNKILIPVAKKLNSSINLVHGSRDYFQIPYKTICFEIIPVKYIENINLAENIMDYSPFHVDWIKKELSKYEKKGINFSNDIRLMKKFLKSARVYGAESYIKGFSGHVNDILNLYYGGFEKTLFAISKWNLKDKILIDYNKSYKGLDVKFFMNDSKIQGPLIVVDPIDKNRNAAAALGIDCTKKLIKKAKEFLKNPSLEYFEEEKIDSNYFEQKFSKKHIFSFDVKSKTGKLDVVGSKLLKGLEYIEKRLIQEGFTIITKDWTWDKKEFAKFYLVLENINIEEIYLKKGPFLNLATAIEKFKFANPNSELIEKDNRVYAKVKRNFIDAKKALKEIIKEEYLKEKIESIKIN